MLNLSEVRRNISRRIVLGCIALFALVVLAAACNTADTAVYDEATSPEVASTPAPGASSSDSADSDGTSPLFDLIGVPLANDEQIEDYYNDLYAQADRQITTCMVAQGFEYTPIDYSKLGDSTVTLVDTREFAEEHGFGITSLDDVADIPEGLIEEFEDPNSPYIESLTAGEFEAFGDALYGARDGAAQSGCQHEAFEEAFAFVGVFEEFGFDFDGAEQLINADPRIVEVQSQWNTCMAQAGYASTDRAALESDIQDRLESLLSDSAAFSGDTLRPEVQRQIDRLAAEERASAVASWDCTEPLRELERTVQREYEQRFVNEHGVAIRAALGSSTDS